MTDRCLVPSFLLLGVGRDDVNGDGSSVGGDSDDAGDSESGVSGMGVNDEDGVS